MKTRLDEIRETLEKFSDSTTTQKLGISLDKPVSGPEMRDKIKIVVEEFNDLIPPLYHELCTLGSPSEAIDTDDLRRKCKSLSFRVRALSFMYRNNSGDENGIPMVSKL